MVLVELYGRTRAASTKGDPKGLEEKCEESNVLKKKTSAFTYLKESCFFSPQEIQSIHFMMLKKKYRGWHRWGDQYFDTDVGHFGGSVT